MASVVLNFGKATIFKTRNRESGNGMGNRGMKRGMEREKPESLKPLSYT